MKKVLFILPSLSAGGAEKVISTIIPELSKSKLDIHLCLIHKSDLFFKIPKTIKIHTLGKSKVSNSVLALIQLIWKIKPDSVFSTLAHLNMFILFARPFLPHKTKIFVREGSVVKENIKSEPYPKIMAFLYRYLYKTADKIICQSEYMVNELNVLFNIPKEKCLHIYNPVVFETDTPNNPFFDVKNYPKLISVGRLDKVKQLHLVINAIPHWLKKYPNLNYTIVGDGLERETLQQLILEKKLSHCVHFVGSKKNVFDYLKHADCFILCSKYEGLPNTLLEAISAQCPMLILKHEGGAKEVLEQCDLNQYYCDSLELNDKALEKVANESYEKAKALLHVQKISEQYLDLFNNRLR